MLPMTREWVLKAESDFDAVSTFLRSRKPTRYDPLCFNSQQCVEKYLKARLTEARLRFPKTHDLRALLNLAMPLEPGWSRMLQPLKELSRWAVASRYPGTWASKSDAREAVATCRRFRKLARVSLGLPV